MSDEVRILRLTPPTGNSTVKCKAIACERAVENWTQVVPLLQAIQNGKMPAGSALVAFKSSLATFRAPDGGEMQFDLCGKLQTTAVDAHTHAARHPH